jgi:predicted nucleotidyltransferase
MFDDTSRINQENTYATFEDVYNKVLPELKIKKEYTAILGSAGKKKAGGSSGDIDLAIDFTKTNFSSLD